MEKETEKRLEGIKEKNKDAYLNLGLIAYGPLREIEKLQAFIETQLTKNGFNVVYQTTTARRLKLVKVKETS